MPETALHTAYLGLGSNLGDRRANLHAGLDALATLPGTGNLRESPVYQTSPMGPQDQPSFLNMALAITTELAPTHLLDHLQRIEADLGRAPAASRQHWGPREIDIDILLMDDLVINHPRLVLPHPGIADRWFVLKPLADIAPDLKHPTRNQTIRELLAAIPSPCPGEVAP